MSNVEPKVQASKACVNQKITCPVCAINFAKNYLTVHLTKQHSNIYGTPAWTNSKYAKRFVEIKRKLKESK